MKRLNIACLLILISARVLAADAQEPDVSTPQGAQKAVRIAMEKGDQKEVRRFLQATTPTEEKLADALAANTIAGSELFKAAAAKWGEDETRKQLIGVAGLPPKPEDEEKIQWKIEGDRATMQDTPTQKHMGAGLRKIDGVWKMSMSDIVTNQPEAQVSQMLSMIDKQTRLQKESRKEVDEGKYASVIELRDAMRQKMQVLIQEMAGAVRAAKAPATAPAK